MILFGNTFRDLNEESGGNTANDCYGCYYGNLTRVFTFTFPIDEQLKLAIFPQTRHLSFCEISDLNDNEKSGFLISSLLRFLLIIVMDILYG